MPMDRKTALAQAEENVSKTRQAIWSPEVFNSPPIMKAYMIQDGTYDVSSRSLQEKES